MTNTTDTTDTTDTTTINDAVDQAAADKIIKDFLDSHGLVLVNKAAALSAAVTAGDAEQIAAANEEFRDALLDVATDTMSAAGQDAIDRASEQYVNDDVEIDSNPILSVGEEGTWVSAWVHVRHKESDGESSDEDESEEEAA